jgi:hypothetical protein
MPWRAPAQTHKAPRWGIVKSANQAAFLPKGLTPSVEGSLYNDSRSSPFVACGRQHAGLFRIFLKGRCFTDDTAFQPSPKALEAIIVDTRKIGFQAWCGPPVGALLRVMAAMKPGGRLLEIGTGTGVGTCWLLDGMDAAIADAEARSRMDAIAR